jgi:DNA-directed RNA polymerase specialized sigma24 family protein
MTESTDDRLRIEAAQRDPARFGDLYEENFYRVYAYVASRVGDRHQAEDLTADVFREALAGIGKFEWRDVPFGAWLLGIAAANYRGLLQAGWPGGGESGGAAGGLVSG